MKRPGLALGIALVFSFNCLAQRGGARGGGFHSAGGGLHSGGMHGGFRGGGFGYRSYGGFHRGFGYILPYYNGGFFDSYASAPYLSQPAYYSPSPDYYSAPPVVISQAFYGDSEAPAAYALPPPAPAPVSPPAATAEPSNGPVLYLIALRTHTIYPALAWWVEHRTVYYLDLNHQKKAVALASVDPDLSERLNRERHVPFSLGEKR